MEFDKSHFWKPEDSRSRSYASQKQQELSFRESEAEGGKIYIHNPQQQFSLSQQRQTLPIFNYRKEILWLIETFQVTVIVGQTGSGKSTQIPQYLMESGWSSGGRIISCTQPRRLAAQELAQRVAEEKKCILGQEVGYCVRFEDKTTPGITQIKYLTDGMLMRETMLDPLLSQYSIIMIDEAHERSLYTDVIIGLLKKILKKRPELRIIISSATLEAEKYFAFFNETNSQGKDSCSILSIPGRSNPIDVYYLERPTPDYLRAMAESVMDIHHQGEEGDILCFLTGRYEIEIVTTLINDLLSVEQNVARRGWKMLVLPLYSGLSVESQRKVFEKAPRKTRKVIVSTNVAETSVTIPGIVYVVDCGFEKIRLYDAATNMEALTVVACSKSSAKQRAGRAGREQPGKVYRLYTERTYEQIAQHAVPEIQRSNLTQLVMQLKALGIDDILHFNFLSPPPAKNMINALEMLFALKVLDESCKLTPFGSTLVEFPLLPSLARMLIASGEFGCCEEILTIVAMLTVPTIWISPREFRATADKLRMTFAVQEGDMLTLLNVYNQFQRAKGKVEWCRKHFVNHKILHKAEEVRGQLVKYARRFRVPVKSSKDSVNIQKAIICGLFANAAQIQPDGSYKTIRGEHTLHLHPSSVLFKYPPPWVLFYEVIRTTKEYMRDVTAVDPEWLGQLAPHFYDYKKRKEINLDA